MFRLLAPESQKNSCNLICIFLISLISNLATAGLSFLAYFISPNSCSSSNILPLQVWIFGCAIAYSIISLLCITIFGIPYKIGAAIHFSYLFFLNLPFTIAWNIVGAIILFRDSPYCREIYSTLWYVSLSVLIYQWIFIIMTSWDMGSKLARKTL
jgi:hypothetical protein